MILEDPKKYAYSRLLFRLMGVTSLKSIKVQSMEHFGLHDLT